MRSGNLYVADAGNNRVLVYNTPFNAASGEPGAGDGSADFVYGQAGAFTTRSCNPGGANATTLCNPSSSAIDGAGDIYIADAGNSRVLEFAPAGNPPVASDAIASRAYGQGGVTDFSGTQCADGVAGDPPASNHAMCNPGGVAIDAAGDLLVADTGNNRVIEIDAPLAGTQDAVRVFGQGANFAGSRCNRGGAAPTASTLCAPSGLMLDVIGNLWVADANNDRVLEYAPPFGSDSAATMVLGQGDSGNFTTAGCDHGIAIGDLFGLGADSLCAPSAVALDANIDLFVADTRNNRAMIYDGILMTPTPSATPTASATATATATATVTATATASATRDRDGDGDADRVANADAASGRQAEAQAQVDQLRHRRGRQQIEVARPQDQERGDGDDGRGGADAGRAVRRQRRRVYRESARVDGGDDRVRADCEREDARRARDNEQRPEASRGQSQGERGGQVSR